MGDLRGASVGATGDAGRVTRGPGIGKGRGVAPVDAHAPVRTALNSVRLAACFMMAAGIDAQHIGGVADVRQMLLTTNLREVYSRGSLTPQQSSGKISRQLRGAYTNR